MDERMPESEEILDKVWVVKPHVDAEQNALDRRSETMTSALRLVMDGVAPGIIYDESFLPRTQKGGDFADVRLEISTSLTTFRRHDDRQIDEIIIIAKDYAGRELSRKAIGYKVREDDDQASSDEINPTLN